MRRVGWVSLAAVVILVEGHVLPVEVHGIPGSVVLVLVVVFAVLGSKLVKVLVV